jgi:hypothetical protein
MFALGSRLVNRAGRSISCQRTQKRTFLNAFDRTFCAHHSNQHKATLGLSEEDKQIYDVAYAFARERMAPHAAEWDKEETLPGE